MTAFIRKLEALLVPDPEGHRLAPETRRLIEEAIQTEKGILDHCICCGQAIPRVSSGWCGPCRDESPQKPEGLQ